jgi:uncharacterized membrane protein (UPF0127 family)
MQIVLLFALALAGFWLLSGGAALVTSDYATSSGKSVRTESLVTEGALSDMREGQHSVLREEREGSSAAVTWGELIPISLGEVNVQASVADTLEERIAGLSNVPALPQDVVKLFVFEGDGPQSIWMKDMQFPLDIMWFDAEGALVHLEEGVSPDTFPQSFASPIPARYVVEANAGFVVEHRIGLGDRLILP